MHHLGLYDDYNRYKIAEESKIFFCNARNRYVRIKQRETFV